MRRLVAVALAAVAIVLAVAAAAVASVGPAVVPSSGHDAASEQTALPAGLTAADWADIRAQIEVQALSGPLAQQAYLKASNTGAYDNFGYSVAISGDTVVVGAPWEDSGATGVNGDQSNNTVANSGAAYVFVRSGATWTQQAYLKASNPGPLDDFGYSVAISGDTVVVGAPYEDSAATGVNGSQADEASFDSGAAYVFVREGTTWVQQAYLKASNTQVSDNFGFQVAVSGDTVAVGSPWEDSAATGVGGNQADDSAASAGAAYVFVRTGTAWSQQAYLKASNAEANDSFGRALAFDGETVVVGAPGEDSNATGVGGIQTDNTALDSGAAYVFVRTGTAWSQQAFVKASNTGMNDFFAWSVALSGDTLLVGAPSESSGATGVGGNQADNSAGSAGAAYVFARSGTAWTQQAYLKASNTGAGDQFGYSAAISGDAAVVGSLDEDSNATGIDGDGTNNSANYSGAAYVFGRTGTTWAHEAYVKASNTAAYDFFARTVAISGETVVAGAYGEDSVATGIDGDQADNTAGDAGAAYVFAVSAATASATSLTFTGVTSDIDGEATTPLSATLACPSDAGLVEGQIVDFYVDLNGDGDFGDAGEQVGTGTTAEDGTVTVTWTHAHYLTGAFAVRVFFAGTAELVKSEDTGTVTLTRPSGNTTVWATDCIYRPNPASSTTASFSLWLAKSNGSRGAASTFRRTTGLQGSLVWTYDTAYRFTSTTLTRLAPTTIAGYTAAYILEGTGMLQPWNAATGTWGVGTRVSFVAQLGDGEPDGFGIQFTGVNIAGESTIRPLDSGWLVLN